MKQQIKISRSCKSCFFWHLICQSNLFVLFCTHFPAWSFKCELDFSKLCLFLSLSIFSRIPLGASLDDHSAFPNRGNQMRDWFQCFYLYHRKVCLFFFFFAKTKCILYLKPYQGPLHSKCSCLLAFTNFYQPEKQGTMEGGRFLQLCSFLVLDFYHNYRKLLCVMIIFFIVCENRSPQKRMQL